MTEKARLRCSTTTFGTTNSVRATVSVEEAAAILGISRNAGYAAVANGEIPCVRIGRRLLVPRAALERLLAAEAPAPDER